MKSVLAAIGRAIRAMGRATASIVKRTVMIAGKLVTVFMPTAIPALDTLEPEDTTPANDNGIVSENEAIRGLAYSQVTGRMPTPQMLGAVTELQADWIAALDADMCRRVMKASDAEIRAHVRGNRAIKGVLWCDPEAIDDYVTALEIDNARMERDLGLDRPRQPKMPGGM